MEEAKFSANIKFRHLGYECQFTFRSDEGSAAGLMEQQLQAVKWLWQHGAQPSNGNGKPSVSVPELPGMPVQDEAQPVCPHCGQSDELELVHFERGGKPRSAYKCQRCQKWLPDKKK